MESPGANLMGGNTDRAQYNATYLNNPTRHDMDAGVFKKYLRNFIWHRTKGTTLNYFWLNSKKNMANIFPFTESIVQWKILFETTLKG